MPEHPAMAVTALAEAARTRERRVGLLPGSFNPPHLGHVELAVRAKAAAGLDRCFFYVNSINASKRAELAPPAQRRRLLELMLCEPGVSVLEPDFFPDNPDGAFLPQEEVFLPLIGRLRAAFSSSPEIWLVRGSDNFAQSSGMAGAYPSELFAVPHVIGVRDPSHRGYDYESLRRKLFVDTSPVSSSCVRRHIRSGRAIDRLVGPDAAGYIRDQALFGAKAG